MSTQPSFSSEEKIKLTTYDDIPFEAIERKGVKVYRVNNVMRNLNI